MVGVTALDHPVARDVHHRVRPQRAGEDPHQGDPTEVGVAGGLHDLGHQRAVRVAGDGCCRRAVRPGDDRAGVLERRRQRLGEHLEQLVGAEQRQRGRGQHGVEVAARHGQLEVGDDHLLVDLLAGQVAVEQGLVLALGDDRLEQLAAEALDQRQVLRVGIPLDPVAGRPVEDPLRDQADHAGDALVVTVHRQVERVHAVAEQPLADGHAVVEVGARPVELGDDDRAGEPDCGALVPQLHGAGVDAVDRGDDEQRGVGRAQAGPQLADEVGRAGGVEQVDLDARVLERQQRQAHRPLQASSRSARCRWWWCRRRPCRPGGSCRCGPAAPRPAWSCRHRSDRRRRRCGPGRDRAARGPARSACWSSPCHLLRCVYRAARAASRQAVRHTSPAIVLRVTHR